MTKMLYLFVGATVGTVTESLVCWWLDVSHSLRLVGWLWGRCGNFLKGHVDVTWARHVSSDSTVSSVGSSSDLLRSVHNEGSNGQVVSVKLLLAGVRLSVLKKVLHQLNRLSWPSSLGQSELLCLWSSSGGVGESDVWDTSLVVHDRSQVLLSLSELHSSDGSAYLPSVLEVNSHVSSLFVIMFSDPFGFP